MHPTSLYCPLHSALLSPQCPDTDWRWAEPGTPGQARWLRHYGAHYQARAHSNAHTRTAWAHSQGERWPLPVYYLRLCRGSRAQSARPRTVPHRIASFRFCRHQASLDIPVRGIKHHSNFLYLVSMAIVTSVTQFHITSWNITPTHSRAA